MTDKNDHIGKFGIGINKLNNKLTNLLEENKRLEQQNINLQVENRELKKKLQEGDKKFENHQQYVLNLEKHKNEEIQRFKLISQDLEKSLKLLGLNEEELNENDYNKISKEKNNSLIDKNRNNIVKSTTFPNYNDKNDSVQLDENSFERTWSTFDTGGIRVVVGLDFGTTYSGFSYSHVADTNIFTNDHWHGLISILKTNTALQYDDDNYTRVKSWGVPALVTRPTRRNNKDKYNKPVELFKLHLGNLSVKEKPYLPDGLTYEKAITDYLREIGNVIKETLQTCWPMVRFFEEVLLVVTIPAEFSHSATSIMRDCIYKAGLINDRTSIKLQFTTEPEAAAICCIKNLEEHALGPGTTFMIVDCGGGTVDLTTRKLINEEQLGEITERTGDFCGSTFIDAEFIKYLRKKLGDEPMDLLRDNNYGQMQYMIQNFCRNAKIPFTGEDSDFRYEFDIEDMIPMLKQYVTDHYIRETMEDDDWIIEIDFESIKSMFDPVISRIIRLIRLQLDSAQEKCSAIFLVGGFSESKYLQKRIIQEFQHRVKLISVPSQPTAAIMRGATMYGLSSTVNNYVISSRILKYTYGVKASKHWTKGDPIERKTHDGRIHKFDCIAKRGAPIKINEEITKSYLPLYPTQTRVVFNIYYTKKYNAEYCDESGVELLGKITINLTGLELDKLSFGLNFGQTEITATAKNKTNGKKMETIFEYFK